MVAANSGADMCLCYFTWIAKIVKGANKWY